MLLPMELCSDLQAPRAGGNHMGGCQNYGPFLGTLNIRCCIIIGPKRDLIFSSRSRVKGLGICHMYPRHWANL